MNTIEPQFHDAVRSLMIRLCISRGTRIYSVVSEFPFLASPIKEGLEFFHSDDPEIPKYTIDRINLLMNVLPEITEENQENFIMFCSELAGMHNPFRGHLNVRGIHSLDPDVLSNHYNTVVEILFKHFPELLKIGIRYNYTHDMENDEMALATDKQEFYRAINSFITKLAFSRESPIVGLTTNFPFLSRFVLKAHDDGLIVLSKENREKIEHRVVPNVVSELQKFLNSLNEKLENGRENLAVDGIMGPKTYNAIEFFYDTVPQLNVICPISELPRSVQSFQKNRLVDQSFIIPPNEYNTNRLFSIKDGRIQDPTVEFRQTPNVNRYGVNKKEFIIIHYTAGTSFDGAVEWLCNPAAKASAHLVIGRDGKVAQLASFDQVTWHAGKSELELEDGAKYNGLNMFSIGIELVNPGPLKSGPPYPRTLMGGKWDGETFVKAKDGYVTWAAYTPEQLETCFSICKALYEAYPGLLKGVYGHNEISPGRKIDPGPAFPLASFKQWFEGRV